MRIAQIGNIAANAYNLAKFLRRLGVECDSFDNGGGNNMWVPWWEDAEFDTLADAQPSHYDWLSVARTSGFQRPAWAKILGVEVDAPWYDTQEAYQADYCRYIAAAVHGPLGMTMAQNDAEAAAALVESRLAPEERLPCMQMLRETPVWRSVREIARHYDLLVFWGPYATSAVTLPADVKYIACEHATMRLVPLLNEVNDAAIASAYRHADHNVITNADCREAAWCLGLPADRLSFIPHPVDTDFFTPDQHDPGALQVRANIQQAAVARAGGGPPPEVIFLAPARQSPGAAPTGGKRNDRAYYAFKRYIDEAEPNGAPRAVLVVPAWGDGPEVRKGTTLIERMGLSRRVIVVPRAAPKHDMRRLYRACDVVLDQFDGACGSFGTVTAEALACGKPVVSHVDRSAHAWCEDRMPVPPVCQALTTPEVYDWLVALAADPGERVRRGTLGRVWVDSYHSWRQVAEEHLALYARIVGAPPPVPASTAVEPPAPAALDRERELEAVGG